VRQASGSTGFMAAIRLNNDKDNWAGSDTRAHQGDGGARERAGLDIVAADSRGATERPNDFGAFVLQGA